MKSFSKKHVQIIFLPVRQHTKYVSEIGLFDLVKFSSSIFVNLLQKLCNFQLGCTLLSRNKITPEWPCIFIVISIISREITLGQVHKKTRLHYLNHGIVCLCGVYTPGGNHLRKHKHIGTWHLLCFHFNDSP